MKKYVVMTNYGNEGWAISAETDDFDEAVKQRDEWLSMGNREVVIFKPVELIVNERDA